MRKRLLALRAWLAAAWGRRRGGGRTAVRWCVLPVVVVLSVPPVPARAAAALDVIVDVDLGDDIDDAFALSLVLASPELHVVAVVASFGDTVLRARMARRMLQAAGRAVVPVWAGPSTAPGTRFTQSAWAAAGPAPATPVPDALVAMPARLRSAPAGSITLLALAPLTSVGAMIARDPAAFRRLARVVAMGGSIRHGYGARAGTLSDRPDAEYNVRCDPDGLRRLLAVGVPVELMPLDATEIALEDPARARLLARRPVLGALYAQWARNNPWGVVPTLFDVVPVARLILPGVCRPVAMRIAVSDAGVTTPVAGPANVSACLSVDGAAVLRLVERRLD